MANSLIASLKESARQAATGDDRFYKRLPYVFRLKTKPNKGPTGPDGVAVFPLPLNPQRFEYNLPFSGEAAPQQDSGIICEESGIVLGRIIIAGTTGFRLKPQKTITYPTWETAQFTGDLGSNGGQLQDVSGQMAWWILANRCFEGYSQLKKDPDTASVTRMELHIPKDRLHLWVRPVDVRLSRTAATERVTYSYDITLDVLGEAEEVNLDYLSKKGILDQIKETVATIRDTIQGISGAIADLTAALDDLKRFFSGITSILDDARLVVEAATDFANGITSAMELPVGFLASAANLVNSFNVAAEAWDMDQRVRETGMKLEDEYLRLQVALGQTNREPYSTAADDYNTAMGYQIDKTLALAAFDDAEAAQGQATIENTFNSTTLPGDYYRQKQQQPEARLRSYTGYTERMVADGDTLQALAAKHMGSAELWLEIALANRLSPPYIAQAVIPGTLKPGDIILIPVVRSNVQPRLIPGIADVVEPGKSQAENLLGLDNELVQNSLGQWGWSEDEQTMTDARQVRGVKNYAQGLTSRLRTVRGENVIHPEAGVQRLIGTDQIVDQSSELLLRVRQQIAADPRTERVTGISLRQTLDAVILDIDAQPVGFDHSQVIPITLE